MNDETQFDIGRGYRLLEFIGRGSYGEVWKAEAPGQVMVAVKIIHGILSETQAQMELRSLEVVKNLSNPFLTQIQAFWVVDNRLVIVMELADSNLRHRLRECVAAGLPGIPAAELLGNFREAADALDFLHDKHKIHRDIKPDNLLLREGRVKVADFGLVREENPLQASMMVCGTPGYMSPEAWEGLSGAAGDRYSLACSYVELRLNHSPFADRSPANIRLAHLLEAPDLGALPQAEKAVLLRALAKEPSERFATCLEMVDALEQALVDVLPARRFGRLPEPKGKHFRPAARTQKAPENILSGQAAGTRQERAPAAAGGRSTPPPGELSVGAPTLTGGAGQATPVGESAVAQVRHVAEAPDQAAGKTGRRRRVVLCTLLVLLLAAGGILCWHLLGKQGPDPNAGASTEPRPLPGQDKPRAVALLIGVRQPNETVLPSFRFAESDVTHLGSVLQAAGYPAEDVYVLTQGRGRLDPKYMPTAGQIRKYLEWLVKGRKATDTVLLALAGHAITFRGERRFYFCPAGSRPEDPQARDTLIALDEIYMMLDECPARCKVILADCRHELPWPAAVAGAQPFDPAEPWLQPQPPGGGVAVTFSCSGSRGFVHAHDRQGVFYSFVIRGLQGDADQNGDGKVTLGELERYVARETAAYTRHTYDKVQQPRQLGSLSELPLAAPSPGLRHCLAGQKFLARGEYPAAAKEFDKAIEDLPGHAEAYLGRANAYCHLGEKDGRYFDQVLKDCAQVSKLDATAPAAHDYGGDAYSGKEDNERAVKAYSEAIRLDPDFAPTWVGRGLARQSLKQHTEAIEDFSKAIELSPLPTAEYFANRVDSYLKTNNLTAALKDCDEAIRLDKDTDKDKAAYHHFLRGRIHAKLDDHKSAVVDFTRAIELVKDYAPAYHSRSHSYRALGETENADRDMRHYDRLKGRK